MKILSYNIHKGLNVGNIKFILPRIKILLQEMKPDIICLQEVAGHHIRHRKHFPTSPDISQFEYLAEELWPYFTYAKNSVYAKGHHGNAILSRYPIRYVANLDVSTNRFEKRSILHAIIRIDDDPKPFHIICVHFGLSETGRDKQVFQLICRIILEVPVNEPLIVAGDFNDWRERFTLRLWNETGLQESYLTIHGKHAKTFPAWLPIFCLDRIYYRSLTAKSAECLSVEPWDKLSDHAALVSSFEVFKG